MADLPENSWISPKVLTIIAEQQVTEKGLKDARTTFLLAISAGISIGLGFVFYTTVTTGTGNVAWGLSHLVGGAMFSLGLMLIVVCGGELFTSTVLTTVARASRKITTAQMLKTWFFVYAGNFVGSLLLVAIIFLAGVHLSADGLWGLNALNIAQHKLHHTYTQAIMLGIMCNIMVCLAIWMSFAMKSSFEKAIIVILPVALFVATGFEHCVANMFMIPMGMVIQNFAGPEFWTAVGADPSKWASLTLSNFVFDNLIPVTIGNILGGGVFVGLGHWYIHRKPYLEKETTGIKGSEAQKA